MNTKSLFAGRIAIIFIWLLLISLPMIAIFLAARQEIRIGGESSYLRVFVMQEKKTEGIGLETGQPVSTNPPCSKVSVRYFLWAGEPENVTYCQCSDPTTGFSLPSTSEPCSTQ